MRYSEPFSMLELAVLMLDVTYIVSSWYTLSMKLSFYEIMMKWNELISLSLSLPFPLKRNYKTIKEHSLSRILKTRAKSQKTPSKRNLNKQKENYVIDSLYQIQKTSKLAKEKQELLQITILHKISLIKIPK